MSISDRDRHQLEILEESLWRAETRFDRDYLERILAPDFIEFGRSGRIYQRSESLGGPAEPIQAVLRNFDVRLIDANVALVTYVSAVTYRGGSAERQNSEPPVNGFTAAEARIP